MPLSTRSRFSLAALALCALGACASGAAPTTDEVTVNGGPSSARSAEALARASASSTEPAEPPGTTTLFVADQRVDCQGEGPMKCLRVKDGASGEWRLFYSEIAGFDFVAGSTYELRVKGEPRKNAPADASSMRYTLVRVVSKTPAPAP